MNIVQFRCAPLSATNEGWAVILIPLTSTQEDYMLYGELINKQSIFTEKSLVLAELLYWHWRIVDDC